jgi:3,4-dihydroxy 2-butanone 4-phosphate synthase/GTP cyclohydrolase II
MGLATVEEALADFQAGKFVIIVDDEDRENEGDLTIAADFATPEAINFMAREGRGLICIALDGKIVDRLQLPLMVPAAQNRSGFGTNFTVSVEAREGVTTGISAYDRARTAAVLIDPAAAPEDIVSPGHMFPLRAHPDGVLGRRGQTEAGVDLARLAGLTPAAVICEVMAEDGTMARLPQLRQLAARHNLKIISVEALAQYRREREGEESRAAPAALPPVVRVDTAVLPTMHGRFLVTAYRDQQRHEHLLLRRGDCDGKTPLTRIHSECVTGDLLGSLRCDCGDQLQAALRRIGESDCGLLIYLRQEGRGIGLANKIRAYALQDRGLDTVEANLALGFPADGRDFGLAAAILRDQGITAVRLLTNNPHKAESLAKYGIEITERVPHQFGVRAENSFYLRTKAEKMAHELALSEEYV